MKKEDVFTLPDIEVYDMADGRKSMYSDELLAISDPVMRLAIAEKSEAESCGERYSGMEDKDWYESAESLVSLVLGKEKA